jgi:hypothetical protein
MTDPSTDCDSKRHVWVEKIKTGYKGFRLLFGEEQKAVHHTQRKPFFEPHPDGQNRGSAREGLEQGQSFFGSFSRREISLKSKGKRTRIRDRFS